MAKRQPGLKGYFEYVHSDSQVQTLQQLIDYKGYTDITPAKILAIKNNRENIYNAYRKEIKKLYKGKEQDFIPVGVKLLLPFACINEFRIVTEGNKFVFPDDNYKAFITDRLKEIITDPGYKRSFKNVRMGSLQKHMANVSVFIWCKALGSNDNNSGIVGEIFDLTPFIENCSTSVSGDAGSFSLSLPPLVCENTSQGWKIKKNSLLTFYDARNNKNFVAKGSAIKLVNDYYKRSNFLFHNIISSNDIVFIRFEKLNFELDRDNGGIRTKVDKKELPGKVYDMIGLVDSNQLSYNAESTQVDIKISGRDLVKLLIEDNPSFINIPDLQPIQGVLKNANYESFGRPIRRLDLIGTNNNPIAYFNSYRAPTIGEVISLLFSTLATIEVCPDDLFMDYGQKRSSYILYDFKTEKAQRFVGAGIWQIVKVLVDESVKNRLIVDSSIDTFGGSLLNAVKKYVQEPFAELITDTYGDQFYFIVRRPPTDKQRFLDLAYIAEENEALHINEEDVLAENLEYDDSNVYCWYRLVPNGDIVAGRSKDLFEWPVVYFREYNEIWGNRTLEITSNYIHYESYASIINQNNHTIKNQRNQIYEDLKFMVESHAYLPFTHKGTIRTKGNRLYKKGTVIWHKGRDQFFYVDGVSQSYSTSDSGDTRETTLQVSRGMYNKTDAGEYVLDKYFDIINFPAKDPNKIEYGYKWTVNQDVFNFFLRRRQSAERLSGTDILQVGSKRSTVKKELNFDPKDGKDFNKQ